MNSNRLLPAGRETAAEIQASHEVMDLVRDNSVLSRWVIQLRDQCRSWRDVRAVIEAKIKPVRPLHQRRQANMPERTEAG